MTGASSDGVAPASAAAVLLSVTEDEPLAPPTEEVVRIADSAASDPAPVVASAKAGWLLKRAVSATMYKNWRKRYVVVDPAGLVELMAQALEDCGWNLLTQHMELDE